MLTTFAPPPDTVRWLDGCAIVRLGGTTTCTRFPATPHAMLTVLLPDHPGAAAASLRLHPLAPATFHTMTTVPTVHEHGAVPVRALGVLLRPTAAACLLGASTGALVDTTLPWSAVAGDAEALRLHETIAAARSDAARLGALVDAVRRAMSRAQSQRLMSIEQLCQTVGRHGLAASDTLDVGVRQLERRVRAVLGLPPKQFQRLMRFHQALNSAIVAGTPPDAGLALDAGYYDQSHLARDFRALAGAAPTALVEGAHDQSAWWPLASYRGMRGAGPLAG